MPRAPRTFGAFATLLAIALLYLGAEIVYRSIVYARAADNVTIGSLVGYTLMPVVREGMHDVPGVADTRPEHGFYPPNADITLWSYIDKDRLIDFHRAANIPLNPAVTACTDPCRILHVTYHSNNFGLLSWRDYKLEKDPDEFRIVVLGQEQTAVATANVSWPDHLEDVLNADRDLKRVVGKKFTVLNFGWIDGSFGHFSEAWKTKAKFLNPDLIIINYVETDFYRPKEQPKNVLHGKPVDYYPYTFYIDGDPRDWVTAILICTRPAASLEDPECSIGLSLGAAMSRSVGDDPEKVGKAIDRLRDEFISGVVWSAWKPLLALRVFL